MRDAHEQVLAYVFRCATRRTHSRGSHVCQRCATQKQSITLLEQGKFAFDIALSGASGHVRRSRYSVSSSIRSTLSPICVAQRSSIRWALTTPSDACQRFSLTFPSASRVTPSLRPSRSISSTNASTLNCGMFRLAIDLSRIFSFVASVPLQESSLAPKLPSVYGEGPGALWRGWERRAVSLRDLSTAAATRPVPVYGPAATQAADAHARAMAKSNPSKP